MSTLFPTGYGYVFGVLGGSFFMNIYLTINVALARRKYDVKYPALYAPVGHKHEVAFNCVQRAHQQTLESFSYVMLLTAVNGLVYPLTAAGCGAVYCVGKVIYGYGYATGGPEGRQIGGAISHLGDFPLVIMSLKIAYDMIVADKR